MAGSRKKVKIFYLTPFQMESNEITVHLISCTCEKCKCECWYQESLSTSVNCALLHVLVISFFFLLQGKRSQWTWISTYVHIFEISIRFYTFQYKFENLIWQSNKAPVSAKSNSWTLVKLTGSTPSLSLFSLFFRLEWSWQCPKFSAQCFYS